MRKGIKKARRYGKKQIREHRNRKVKVPKELVSFWSARMKELGVRM